MHYSTVKQMIINIIALCINVSVSVIWAKLWKNKKKISSRFCHIEYVICGRGELSNKKAAREPLY